MQSYIKYGLGFSASLLTDEEFSYVTQHSETDFDKEINLDYVYFEEDCMDKYWTAIILKNCGEFPTGGKFATFEQVKRLVGPEMIIDLPTKEAILAELKRFNLERLLAQVDIVFYVTHY